MTSIDDKLKFLDAARSFEITERENGVYNVEDKENNLAASYSPEIGWVYFITDCYNSSDNWGWFRLNVKALEKFIEFTKFLSE